MDKKIRKIEEEVKDIHKKHDGKHDEKKMDKSIKKVGKDLKDLERMDKKRDPSCDLGKKMMKKKK